MSQYRNLFAEFFQCFFQVRESLVNIMNTFLGRSVLVFKFNFGSARTNNSLLHRYLVQKDLYFLSLLGQGILTFCFPISIIALVIIISQIFCCRSLLSRNASNSSFTTVFLSFDRVLLVLV